jgi:hypothetical protein
VAVIATTLVQRLLRWSVVVSVSVDVTGTCFMAATPGMNIQLWDNTRVCMKGCVKKHTVMALRGRFAIFQMYMKNRNM